MANKAKRRTSRVREIPSRCGCCSCSSAQAREAARRLAMWQAFGRGFLRLLLWSFFIMAAVGGAAARWGL